MGKLRFETLAAALVGLSLALGCSSGGAAKPDDDAAGTDANGGDVTADATRATLPDFADGTRLKALTYVLDDGTRVWRGWWDGQRNEECSFWLASDGKTRCLPAATPTYTFSDAECQAPLEIALAGDCGPAPAYLLSLAPGGKTSDLHKRLAEIAKPAAWYALDTGSCAANATDSDPAGAEYWTGGGVEAATSFVAAEEIRDARGPGLMARYYRAEDGALQLLGAYDVARARDCVVTPYVPGACVPDPLPQIYGSNEFSDAACTMPTADFDPFVLDSATPPDYVLKNPSRCSTISKGQIYKVGAPYTERPFLESGMTCYQNTTTKFGTASPNRRELEQVQPSAFPTARFVDEGQGRIKVRTVETEDGLHLAVTGLVDSVADGTCTPFLVEGQLRCLPDDLLLRAPFAVFVDPECKQLGYTGTGSSCDVPKFVTQWDVNGCTRTPHDYEVRPPLTPQQTFVNTTGTCMDQGPLLGTIYPATERPLTDAPLVGSN